jgi:superfamily II DNA or RNA helicase
MSRCKLAEKLTADDKAILRKKAKISPRADNWNPYPKPLVLFEVDEDGMCWFPFYLGKNDISDCCNVKSTKDFEEDEFYPTRPLLTPETDPYKLKRDQKTVMRETLSRLKDKQCVFLNLSTGFGKSAMSVHICSRVKRGKKMILVFNLEIQKGWLKTFKDFSTATVQHVTGNKQLDPKANVYIVGLKKAALCDRDFFKDISMLVIDEVDQLPAKTLIKVMKKVNPVYLVGLTATINRDDNLHQALYSYFGPRESFISRFIVKNFDVIKYQTKFKPEIEYNNSGQIDNNILLDSIAYNEDRQDMICDLMQLYAEDKILALSKRVGEIEAIYQKLVERGEDVDYKNQNKTKWDTSKRLLIGGVMSCGRGVDIPGVKILIMLSSVNHVEQNEGRVREDNGMVIDIVDEHPIFETRFKKRMTWYKKRGATIFFQNHGSEDVKFLSSSKKNKK